MRESKIQYNPSLSVKENAKRNDVTEAAIRYYIKVNNIDRRFDRTQNLIADCRKYLKKHPNATKAELHEKTGHSLSTIRIYWEHITTEKELTNFNSQKKQKRQLRQLNNFYATHPSCTADILREEEFYKDVLEPFCGVGSMSEVIKQHGHNVLSYDIVDRGYGLVGDFYRTEFPRRKFDIITNPPYDNVIDVVLRCLDICKEKVAVLMPLRYLSSGSRYNELYKKCPPKRVYVYQERICIAKNADFEKYEDTTNMEIYAWYIWERGFKGTTELKWISNQRAVTKKTVKNTAKVKELKEQVDALMKVEAENTAALKANPSYLPIPTKQDFCRVEQYNVAKHHCVPFRSKGDMWEGMQIPLGNMNGGYSYMMHGVEFPTSEHAYIFGIFSNNVDEHISLQQKLLANTNGLTIKRGIRYKNRHLWRSDWSEFNVEWMLHCVWTKANQCEEFKKLLLSLPQGITIIEDVSFKHYDENGADFWGARNPDKAAFDNLVKKYAKQFGLSDKAAKNDFIWKYYNVGTYTGHNVMGKILTYIKQCLHDGTEPDIDYQLLKSKNIHFLGNLIDFNSSDANFQPSKELSETKPVEVVEKKPIKKKQAKEAKAAKKPKKINTTIRCTDTHVYFYQNTPLSNWWVSEPAIPYDNRTFTSSEALFMYLKAKVFRDDYMADVIAPTLYDVAKELGGLVRNFDETIWERERENAMYIALKAKLKVDNVYRETLLSDEYRGKTFVEASPSDDVWGIHLSIEDAYNGKKWQGLNLLGKLHTIIRDELLGLREPQQRDITPITDEEFAKIQRDNEEKANKRAKMPPSKNKYSADGILVRSVIGGVVGDIAGSSREGYRKSQSQVREILKQDSYFTDDTTMIVAVADWLNHKDEISLKDCMIKWYNRFPNVGFGGLFQAFAETGEAQPSNANGGAMRVAPLAVTANTLDEALALAEEQCLVSHTTDIAINGTKAIAAAIFLAKEGIAVGKSVAEIKDTIKSYIEEHFGYDLNMSLKDIQARSERLSFLKALYNIAGIASEEYENNNLSSASLSCPMAIMAFLYGENYEASIRYALAMGGDADTIACMAGCISAQVYGIPKQIVDEALLYLPPEMIDVLNEFEKENTFEPTGITPPKIVKWSVKNDVVVYGIGDKVNESGKYDTLYSRDNRYPKKGYTIPTIGKSIEEIQESVNVFIEHAKNNPDMRFHVRKVGYDKAGYTVEQIAPLFREARAVRNILLPKAIVDMLNS